MDKIISISIFVLFICGLAFFWINQRNNIRQWLLYAVIEAEKELGCKTGKIKLRQVYNAFISTFPIISKILKFEYFSKLVDLALVEMKNLIETNINCKKYVEESIYEY